MITRSILLSTIALLGLTSTAAAHIVLVEPTPRVPDASGLKGGPCGGAVWGANGFTTFAPGQQVAVKVVETVSHQGAFRLAMDMDGDNDFTPMVSKATFDKYVAYFGGTLAVDQLPAEVSGPVAEGNMIVLRNFYGLHPGDNCPSNKMETVNGEQGCLWNIQVTLPNQTCENCTLQVIQMMSDVGHGYTGGFYYHCADIKIEGQPASNTGGAGNTGTGGAPANSGGAAVTSGGSPSSGGASSSSAGGTASSSGGKSTGGSANTGLPGAGGAALATGGAAGIGRGSPQGAGTGKKSGCGIFSGSSPSSRVTWLASLGLGALLVRRARSNKLKR